MQSESPRITLLNLSVGFHLSSTANATTVKKPRALKPQIFVKKKKINMLSMLQFFSWWLCVFETYFEAAAHSCSPECGHGVPGLTTLCWAVDRSVYSVCALKDRNEGEMWRSPRCWVYINSDWSRSWKIPASTAESFDQSVNTISVNDKSLVLAGCHDSKHLRALAPTTGISVFSLWSCWICLQPSSC